MAKICSRYECKEENTCTDPDQCPLKHQPGEKPKFEPNHFEPPMNSCVKDECWLHEVCQHPETCKSSFIRQPTPEQSDEIAILKKEIDRLRSENETLKKDNEWISVETWPPLNEWVLICLHGEKNMRVARLDEHGNFVNHSGLYQVKKHVTHWRNLPSPPTKQ